MNSKFLIAATLIIGLMMPFQQSFSQSLATADLSTINVDDISDEQIMSYLRQAENSGYSEQELELLARQRGMSETEITKLRRRINELSKGSMKESNTTKIEDKKSFGRQSLDNEPEDVFGQLARDLEKGELSYKQKRIFGYALFHSSKLDFTPNLNIPTPIDYQVGPGDEITVDLWGATELNETLTISPEGIVRPEGIRPVYVNGLSIEKLKEVIKNRYADVYSGIRSTGNSVPTIFIETSLTGIRTINVSIIGEVNFPGNYALNSLSTVYTALYASGGPNENGTFRQIQLIRDNKVFKTIDVYAFLTSGMKSNDVLLRSGDIILVKPYGKRIELEGEVRREGSYEVLESEVLHDVLKFASGFNNKAYQSRIQITRNSDFNKQLVTVEKKDFGKASLKNGDQIMVKEILDRFENRIIVKGAVLSPGQFELQEGMTIMDALSLADGIQGDAFDQRINLLRTNDDFTMESLSFNYAELTSGKVANIFLKNDDVISVPSIYDLRGEHYVKISGLVNQGGTYPFINQMTVQDLIVLAGGTMEGASLSNIEIARRNNTDGLNNLADIVSVGISENFESLESDGAQLLKPYDQVFVRALPGYEVQKTVSIEGEVVTPGEYALSRKDERVSDIIKRAQGLTPYAYAKGAILVRKTEFSTTKSDLDLSNEYISDLQKRILEFSDNDVKSNGMSLLIERLEQVKARNTDSEIKGEDEIGSKVKKDLLEGNVRRDSLSADIDIKEDEPVTIELDLILNQPRSKFDLILRPGDVISIPGKLETVRVAGEVTSPLSVRFDEDFSFRDYIMQSGGFLVTAKKSRSYVQYPNGERKGVKRFLWFKTFPKVQPGSTIFVSRKAQRRGLNTAEWLAVASSLATIALTVNTLAAQ